MLQSDPQFVAARYKLGLAYRALQRLKESYNTLVQCARLQPTDGIVFLGLGIVLNDLGQQTLSIKAFERAAKLLPNEPQIHYRLGRSLISAGYEARALVAWQRAIELDERWQAARGLPGGGDPLYLRRVPAVAAGLPPSLRLPLLDFPRQALHAASLGFRHPVTGQHHRYVTAPPADFQALVALLDPAPAPDWRPDWSIDP